MKYINIIITLDIDIDLAISAVAADSGTHHSITAPSPAAL